MYLSTDLYQIKYITTGFDFLLKKLSSFQYFLLLQHDKGHKKHKLLLLPENMR